MNIWTLLPLLLGTAVVIQGTLNFHLSSAWGLPTVVLVNGTVFFLACVFLYFLARHQPQLLPHFFQIKNVAAIPWYFWIPGLCGFSLVLGVPMAIQNLGATPTFVLIVSAQVLCSFFIDWIHLKQPLSLVRLSGALLVLAGVVLVSFKK